MYTRSRAQYAVSAARGMHKNLFTAKNITVLGILCTVGQSLLVLSVPRTTLNISGPNNAHLFATFLDGICKYVYMSKVF